MKLYNVQTEVTTSYTVEVYADDREEACARAWKMDIEEIEAQGSAEETEVTGVSHLCDAEGIQRESEDE